MEQGSQQGVEFENTTGVMYKFLEEKLKIERPREKIELHRIHFLGRPNSLKPCPIIARFLQYSDRELVMEVLVNTLKVIKIFMSSRTYRRTYTSYGNSKWKNLRKPERGHKAYFSKANPDKLFVNGKYVAPDQPLQ